MSKNISNHNEAEKKFGIILLVFPFLLLPILKAIHTTPIVHTIILAGIALIIGIILIVVGDAGNRKFYIMMTVIFMLLLLFPFLKPDIIK